MNMKVSKVTIRGILNKEYGKPRKIKKVFFPQLIFVILLIILTIFCLIF
jgi:hypothetical protein